MIDKMKDKEITECLRIIKELPDFFLPSSHNVIEEDLSKHDVYVHRNGKKIEGFIAIKGMNNAVPEISWMAVSPEKKRSGIGSALLGYVEKYLLKKEKQLLKVKTLARQAGDKDYEATQNFYERYGFIEVEVIDPYPGWAPGNPCAVYIKVIKE
jgi:N-acetylglutamate synthase-like GNAT family acetyltransferase